VEEISRACGGMGVMFAVNALGSIPILGLLFTTRKEIKENVETVNSFESLGQSEWSQVNAILDGFQKRQKQFCTACGYCMPCPHGVDIPSNFKFHNYDTVYGFRGWATDEYRKLEPANRADQCTECGECEPKCPNTIPIRNQLKMVRERYQ